MKSLIKMIDIYSQFIFVDENDTPLELF